MKRVVLTGGGSAGHVTPNLALIPELRGEGWDIHYIGTQDGIERELIGPTGVPYHRISAGKLRRYADLRNLTDPLQVVKGVWQVYRLLRQLRPRVVFSKGGFVAVPVVFGAWLNRIPVIAHESDLTPGLANRLSLPFVTRVCVTFPETMAHLPKGKAVLTGTPIRPELMRGQHSKGLELAGLNHDQPVLMVMGGSLGATRINEVIRQGLPELRRKFQIIHICGKGKSDPALNGYPGYTQFEYVTDGLADLMAAADLMVSRAGANFLFELLALRKPSLLIPLPKGASRGDQILNANSFEKQGFSMVLPEESLAVDSLVHSVLQLYEARSSFVKAMEQTALSNGIGAVMQLIRSAGRA